MRHLTSIKIMIKNKIIGFAGRKRSGKGMLANAIKEYDKNTIVIAVADNLKFLCAELLNVTVERLNRMKDDGTTFREKVDGRWVTILNHRTNLSDETICREIKGKIFTNVREVLQVIGTDLIRKYRPNWHIDKTVERIESMLDDESFTGNIVIDDIRFPNEKCAIEKLGGEVFFVIRPNCIDISNHPSETALKYTDFLTKNVIINDMPKDVMASEFINYYFNNVEECSVLLSNNLWYCDHMIDMKTDGTNFNVVRRNIIKIVIDHNINKPLFKNNGIITFENDDPHVLHLFRCIVMNGSANDGYHRYVIYNPLTNEILKEYM